MAKSRVEKKQLNEARRNEYLTKQEITDSYGLIKKIAKQGHVEHKNEAAIREDQVFTISQMDTKESIPVLLRLLLKLEKNYQAHLTKVQPDSDDSKKIQASLDLIADALSIFGETDRVANLGMLDKGKYFFTLKSKTQEIVSELKLLVEHSQQALINNKDTRDRWSQISMWLYSIYRRTADKAKRPRPCYRVIASELPTSNNLERIITHKYNANYVRYADKLFYVNPDAKIFQAIPFDKDQAAQFDERSQKMLNEKQLKLITSLTDHAAPKNTFLVVMDSPAGQIDVDTFFKYIKPKYAYVRRGDALYYVSMDPQSVRKIEFKKPDGLKKLDKELEVDYSQQEFKEAELQKISRLTGHTHSRDTVVFRNDNGEFPLVEKDKEDLAFHAMTGLTKMEISLYYLQAAEQLDKLIKQYDASHVRDVKNDLRQTAPAATPKLTKTKATVFSAQQPELPRAATVGAAPPLKVAAHVPVGTPVPKQQFNALPRQAAVKPEVKVSVSKTVETVDVVKTAPPVVEPKVTVSASMTVESEVVEKTEVPVTTVTATMTREEEVVEKTKASVTKPQATVTASMTIESEVVEKTETPVIKPAATVAASMTVEMEVVEKTEEPETKVDDDMFAGMTIKLEEDADVESDNLEMEVFVPEANDAAMQPVTVSQAADKLFVQSFTSFREDENNLIYTKSVASSEMTFLKEVFGIVSDLYTNPLVADLKQHAGTSDTVKLSTFISAIRNNTLTTTQKSSLANFRDEVIKELNKYLHENFYAAHKKIVKEQKEKLLGTEDVQEHLLEVVNLNVNIKHQDSHRVYAYTSKVLLAAREILCPSYLEADLVVKISINNDNVDRPELRVEVSKRHAESFQRICDFIDDLFVNPLVARLKTDLFSKDEIRISGLQSALMSFNLTPKQKVQLSGFRDEAIDTLRVYMKSGWRPKHYLRAEKYIDKLEKENDIQKQLLLMLKLHRKMYSETSDKLYKGLTTLLLNALEILSPKPRMQLEAAPRPDASAKSTEEVDAKNTSFLQRIMRM